ncbi:MAG: flagellar biosynthetic protein FliR [Myxococcaceae bacterium]
MNQLDVTVVLHSVGPHAIAVGLCAARLLPVAFLCPFFGGSFSPTTVKLALVLALSLFLHVSCGIAPPPGIELPTVIAMLAKEVSFGLALGMVSSLPFDSARIGGRLIDLFRGSSAEASLPYAGTKEAATGDGLYQLLLALACLGPAFPVALGGLLKSFGVVKLGGYVATESASMYVVSLVGTAFATGLAVGAPVAGAAMAVDCALGLASRAAPQLNLQETGVPARILGGAAILWIGLGVICERLLTNTEGVGAAFESLMGLAR